MVAEAEEDNLDLKVLNERWNRWHTCSLCEQEYHGVVRCALGWACWKTYVDRPETDDIRRPAITLLGNGLSDGKHYEDALSVREAELAMCRRLGASEEELLNTLGNIANSYHKLGQHEQAVCMRREVYTRALKLFGEGHKETLVEVNNYATDLCELRRFDEAKSLLRKAIPVARRSLGDRNENTLRLRWNYARALYLDDEVTPDGLREAVTRLEELAPYARRILGGTHPGTTVIELTLRDAQAALRAAEQS